MIAGIILFGFTAGRDPVLRSLVVSTVPAELHCKVSEWLPTLQIMTPCDPASASIGGYGDVHGVRDAVVAHHRGQYHVSVGGLELCW